MKCLQVRQRLSMYHDGHPAGREAAGVAAHLQSCAACRLLRDQMLAVENEVRATVRDEWGWSPHLCPRVIDRWLAERAVSRSPAHQPRFPHPSRQAVYSCLAMASLAAALLVAGSVAWRRWDARGRRQGQQIVRTLEREQPVSVSHSDKRVSENHLPRRGPRRPAALSGTDHHGVPQPLPHDSLPSPSAVQRRPPGRAGDLAYWNADPVRAAHRWASVREDEWDQIERRVRQAIRAKDDFITLPFPRLASTAPRQIAQAVESYKREATIVDPRLSREVTCAFKGTALSDLCAQLRTETGIELTAGPSVADEKVTVFCEKMPLRDIMRQLSRPFGYTWLRSRKEGGEYRYELVQDLRSQLLEEELRNRDRDAALIALDREIERYRPYRDLSPDEAHARSQTAAPEEKKLLEKLAGAGWGPLQMYFRLSPQDLAALRAGQTLWFDADPGSQDLPHGAPQPLPPDVARGVLQSRRETRLVKQEKGYSFIDGNNVAFPSALPAAVVPEARASVNLQLEQTELGQMTLDGGSGVMVGGINTFTGNGPYATGISPTVLQPRNEEINARFAGDADLHPRVSVQPQPAGRPAAVSGAATAPGGPLPQPAPKVTSADVLQALHRATGLPIVSDFYTRLYQAGAVSVRSQPLFDALNHLSDAMHLRWSKEGSWLQFRSASFYNDRLKEVPNRLLARWAAARRERGALTLDEFLEIAELPDAQLDAADMAEGARECWGLKEWDLARGKHQRPHWRYLAQLTPAQREQAMSVGGLAFTRMSVAQQQQFISLRAQNIQSLEELAGATLRVGYTQSGGFQWNVPEGELALPGRGALGLSPVHEPTRAMALQAARRIDPGVDPAQIGPTELALTVVYTLGSPTTGLREMALQVTADGVRMWPHDYPAQRGAPAGGG